MNKIFKDRFILFTDASVNGKVDMKHGNSVMGGCCIYDSLINKFGNIDLFPFNRATNNFGEMISIYNAARYCIELNKSTGETDFTIMSDSQYCIFSLRDWVYNWYRNVGKNNEYTIFTSSGNQLKNRFLIDSFIMMLCYSNIRLKLIYVSGHTDSIKKNILEVFCRSNFPNNIELSMGQKIDLQNELHSFLIGNIKVDEETRNAFKNNYLEQNAALYEQRQLAFAPTYENMRYYRMHIASRKDIYNALLC